MDPEVFMRDISMLPIEREAAAMNWYIELMIAKDELEASKACIQYAKERIRKLKLEMRRRIAGASDD